MLLVFSFLSFTIFVLRVQFFYNKYISLKLVFFWQIELVLMLW